MGDSGQSLIYLRILSQNFRIVPALSQNFHVILIIIPSPIPPIPIPIPPFPHKIFKIYISNVCFKNTYIYALPPSLQRAITPKVDGIEIWFLYTALVLNVIYLCVKFEVIRFYNLKVMPRTKIHSKNLQRAITQ